MNVLQQLSSEAWVARLGWTLVHFLWQGILIAALYAAVRRRVARTSTPNLRYLLACAAMAAMLAAPLVTWGLMRAPETSPNAASRIHSVPASASATAAGSDVLATTTLGGTARAAVSVIVQPARILAWVVMLWLAGAVVFWLRLAGSWMAAARMRSMLVRRAPPEWQETLRSLGELIGVSRPVQLLVSALVEAPAVVGWLRPVVLVPVGALSGLATAQLEALLLHELAHIRRHDYMVNVLQSVAEALLFYHPAVWWVSAHIRAERELCCDDVAVAVSGDRLTYARALALLESYRPAHLNAAMAASGGSLADRIARLLGQSRPPARSGVGPGVLVVAMLGLAAAYGLFGQSGAHPAFESVSIRPNTSEWSERFRHPMSMKANASLMFLIRFVYGAHENPMLGHTVPLPASQVVGGPSWMDSEGYDIDAKPAANSDPKQYWLMWQTLLADRFKLTLHRETRDLPVYVLTAAQNGFHLPAPKDADCVSFPPGTMPRQVPQKADCGYVTGPISAFTPGLLQIEGNRIHMADLIRELTLVLDRPVLDQTGFGGEFDLNLKFRADEATAGLAGFVPTLPRDPNLPGIFAALAQQLGLKLVPAKGPVEVLVVDHAERPTAD